MTYNQKVNNLISKIRSIDIFLAVKWLHTCSTTMSASSREEYTSCSIDEAPSKDEVEQ
jgi:hypothetical protein